MKSIVLAAGKGTRLKPFSNTMCKQLLPIANKPILFYILDQIVRTGIRDIGIIVSPENGESIKEAIGNDQKWSADITYILQSEPLGLAHAVMVAQDFLNDSPFLMFLGDNLVKGDIIKYVERFNRLSSDALVLPKQVKEPQKFGVAELNDRREIIRLEEKPTEPRSDLALIGIYLFSPTIYKAIANIKPSRRGELEITDALQELISKGKKVNSDIHKGWWLDTGTKEDVLAANRIVLDETLEHEIKGNIDLHSRIMRKVNIDIGTTVENCAIQGPVIIGKNCTIKDSSIGPYTSIGDESVIDCSTIKNTIMLGRCIITGVDHLYDSLIGKNTELSGVEKRNNPIKLFIGDDSKIELR